MGNLYGVLFNTELTANDSAAKDEVGMLRHVIDATNVLRVFKYVQTASDTTVANGTALSYVDVYGGQVTSDISDSKQNFAAGVGIGAITASYYGWIQVRGYHSAVATDAGDDIVKGDAVILHATLDGVVDRMAAGTASTHKPLGFAVADDIDAADTVAVYITAGS
jgi:alpha-acetolactate decarboxylase